MRQHFCLAPGCKTWFQGSRSCPECGRSLPGFNRWLAHAKMDSHLFGMANQAHAEKKVLTREQLRPR